MSLNWYLVSWIVVGCVCVSVYVWVYTSCVWLRLFLPRFHGRSPHYKTIGPVLFAFYGCVLSVPNNKPLNRTQHVILIDIPKPQTMGICVQCIFTKSVNILLICAGKHRLSCKAVRLFKRNIALHNKMNTCVINKNHAGNMEAKPPTLNRLSS